MAELDPAPAPKTGFHLDDEEEATLFARYWTALQFAIYWPDVEHFRRAVKAYDEMIAHKGTADGQDSDG